MKAQPRAPLALAAAGFACGIWLAGHLDRPTALWGWSAAALALCATVGIATRAARVAQIASVLALICAGAFARVGTPLPPNIVPPAEFLGNKHVEIVGHVTNDGALLAGGPRERFDLETELITLDGHRFLQPVGIRATAFSREANVDDTGEDAPDIPRLAYGDRVRLTAKLHLPRNFHNPGAFDYEGYLNSLGISTLASVKAEKIEVLPGRSGSLLGFWRSRVRHSILEHIHRQG